MRPNDDPGQPFYYRLRPLRETLVEKTHITYALDAQRMDRWQELFLQTTGPLPPRPGYAYAERSNQFITFTAIPARARYQFMLDSAEYFVRSLYSRPGVPRPDRYRCHSRPVLTVFEDPQQEAYVNDPLYRSLTTPLLGPAGQDSDLSALGAAWLEYSSKRNQYLMLRHDYYAERKPAGADMAEIWGRRRPQPGRAATIFRHHDSASVRRGYGASAGDHLGHGLTAA